MNNNIWNYVFKFYALRGSIQDVEPMLVQYWPTVYDAARTLYQYCINALLGLGYGSDIACEVYFSPLGACSPPICDALSLIVISRILV